MLGRLRYALTCFGEVLLRRYRNVRCARTKSPRRGKLDSHSAGRHRRKIAYRRSWLRPCFGQVGICQRRVIKTRVGEIVPTKVPAGQVIWPQPDALQVLRLIARGGHELRLGEPPRHPERGACTGLCSSNPDVNADFAGACGGVHNVGRKPPEVRRKLPES